MESERKTTIGTYSYKDFFDERRGYLVPRYKSLIGSTTELGAEYFGSDSKVYLVIPFNNSNIIFSGCPDLGLWSQSKEVFRDELFILKNYEDNFKIPLDELRKIRNSSTLGNYGRDFDEYGFEFFTNSNCLLLDLIELDWLRGILE